MSHWSNKQRLDLLNASIVEDVLVFEAGNEKAKVVLSNGDIKEVIFTGGENLKPVLIKATDAHYIMVGEKNTQRDVYHFLRSGGLAPTMRLGITKHGGFGTWSSLPHDFENNPEKGFEEVFFYILHDGTKRAFQVGRGLWCDGSRVDAVWPVYNHSFGVVPMGYHPIVGEPGVHVSYVWCYLAKHKRWEKIK